MLLEVEELFRVHQAMRSDAEPRPQEQQSLLPEGVGAAGEEGIPRGHRSAEAGKLANSFFTLRLEHLDNEKYFIKVLKQARWWSVSSLQALNS